MNLTSAILAGGQNKRMEGRPKWSLMLGQQTALDRAIDKLIKLSNEILIITSGIQNVELQIVPFESLKLVHDKTPHLGPLNGILTALENSQNNYSFVVAADMPFFSNRLIEYMYELAIKTKSPLIIPKWQNRLQPLHGIYSVDNIASIKQALEQEQYSLTKWIHEQEDVYYLEENEIKRITNEDNIFFNMNYPYEYEQVLTWIIKEDKSD